MEVTQRMSGAALEVQISKQLASQEQPFKLDLEFTAQPGISILFGVSGAGKTTLLDCISGLKLQMLDGSQ